jgi:hypothetical protein
VTSASGRSRRGLATVRSPHLPDAGPNPVQALLTGMQKGSGRGSHSLRTSWVEGYGLDVRPQMPIRSRRAEVCTDAAIFC